MIPSGFLLDSHFDLRANGRLAEASRTGRSSDLLGPPAGQLDQAGFLKRRRHSLAGKPSFPYSISSVQPAARALSCQMVSKILA